MQTDNLYSLQDNLPVPEDDGACDHFCRATLPSVGMLAISGQTVDLSKEGQSWLVVDCYPQTGRLDAS
jgi:hypothetical protein